MANNTDSRNPRFQPRPTKEAVAAASTYRTENPANTVSTKDQEEIKITTDAPARAMPMAPMAVFNIC